MRNKTLLKNKYIVCLLAIVCCLLWGSAFPSIKIGYRMFEVESSDAMSQILFAGIRFGNYIWQYIAAKSSDAKERYIGNGF